MGREVSGVWLGAADMITALGASAEEAFSAIAAYRSGCRTIDDPALWSKPFVAGRIDAARVPELPEYTLLERMFVEVIGHVLAQSEVDPAAADSALIVASTKGNIDLLTGAGATDERVFLGTMAARVADATGFKRTPIVISNACISGVSALIVAARLIRAGKYKNVVVAGGDSLTRFVVTGFEAFKSVSERVCRPYDAARNGLTLGEGCAALLLTAEQTHALEPYIAIAGGSISDDANHISGPSRTGDGLYLALRDAMAEAGVSAGEVGFVNGHGTGTVYNDEMESRAFALAGLAQTPVNSLKPWFGHTLGAAGVVETIVSAQALRSGTIYGTLGFETAGTSVPLDVCAKRRKTHAEVCIKTASGFGGCNAAIVLRKGTAAQKGVATPPPAPKIRRVASVHILPDGRPFGELIRARFKALDSPDMKFFKMDDLCKLGYVAASELLRGRQYAGEEIGLVLADRSASLDTDIRHCRQMEAHGGEVSPAVFVYTLPNVAAGEICIRHKIRGENTFFVQDAPSTDFIEAYARSLLLGGRLEAVIYGWCELLGENFNAELTLLEIWND